LPLKTSHAASGGRGISNDPSAKHRKFVVFEGVLSRFFEQESREESRRCESEPLRRRLMSFKGLDATGRVLQQSVGAIRATTRTGPNDCLNQSYPVGDSVNPERKGFGGGAARDRCIPCGPVAENAATGL